MRVYTDAVVSFDFPRRTLLTAAVFGMPAVGMALLASAGFGLCGERMSADPGMAGMTMSDAPSAAGWCPILVVAALLAFALAVVALGAAMFDRRAAVADACELARGIGRRRLGSTAALLAFLGATPLAAVAAQHGTHALSASGAAIVLGALLGGAVAGALALHLLAGVVLALAVRVIRAVVRALVLAARGRSILVVRPRRRPRAVVRFLARPVGPRAPPFLDAAA